MLVAMDSDDVPADFPQEFLGAVTGAQPKLLVGKNDRGEYLSESAAQRAERWAICADLCEQLGEYVNKKWNGEGPRDAFAEKVAHALDLKRATWGLSLAEAGWVKARLRALK